MGVLAANHVKLGDLGVGRHFSSKTDMTHSTVRGDEVHWSNGVDTDGGFDWTVCGSPEISFERGLNSMTLYLKKMDTFIAQLGEQSELAPWLSRAASEFSRLLPGMPAGMPGIGMPGMGMLGMVYFFEGQ